MRSKATIETADARVAAKARPLRTARPVKAAGTLSELADQPPLYAFGLLTFGAGIFLKDARLAKTGARMFAAEWLATAAKSFVKHRVNRVRPRSNRSGGAVLRTGHSHDSALSSFPSGHSAGAVAVARAVGREYPDQRVAANTIAASVALVQIPRGAHYVSDVVAGTAIGLAAEAVVNAAFDRLFSGSMSSGDVSSGELPSSELTPSELVSGGALPGEALPGEMLSGQSLSGEMLPGDALAMSSRYDAGAQTSVSPVAPEVADPATSSFGPAARPNVASAADIIVAPLPGA